MPHINLSGSHKSRKHQHVLVSVRPLPRRGQPNRPTLFPRHPTKPASNRQRAPIHNRSQRVQVGQHRTLVHAYHRVWSSPNFRLEQLHKISERRLGNVGKIQIGQFERTLEQLHLYRIR